MKPVFADTFYWIALTVPTDAAHARAQRVANEIVTIDEVLIEYLTFFAAGGAYLRRKAVANVQAILQSRSVRVIPQGRESFLSGMELYRARPDKAYSLIDCISMQTMRKEGLTDALTNDRHFEQEGFRAVLRDP